MASEQNYLEKRRLELQSKLEEILGSNNVYFQPPESLKMAYPAIVYERYNIKPLNADDLVYLRGVVYNVTVIDKNPTSQIVNKMSTFPTAKFSRHYVRDNLNHDTFRIIY